jgi:hypothetical protein
MRSVLAVIIIAVLAGGCADTGSEAAAGSDADTLTRAQRDSVIGASSLPGAGSVQRAIDTRDSVNARATSLDSLPR